jgi:hypothetical protein
MFQERSQETRALACLSTPSRGTEPPACVYPLYVFAWLGLGVPAIRRNHHHQTTCMTCMSRRSTDIQRKWGKESEA